MTLVSVKPVEEFEEGSREFLEVEGISIGVFRIEGEFYAIRNRCCHDGGPVCEGNLKNKLVGEYVELGEHPVEYFSDEFAIACPWHGWIYDLKTGEHLGDDRISLETYETIVKEGDVFVRVDA